MGLYRKIFRISAEDSPNVRLAKAQLARGVQPTNEILIPGILPWNDYQKRKMQWDKIKQTISLEAQFYEGAELLLYPPQWLDRAHEISRKLKGLRRTAKAIGIDPAEGGDKTAMAAVDEYGLIELVSKQTPNTNQVVWDAIAFGLKHNVPPEMWCFDRGGGGKEHADRLIELGYKVDTIAFGESPTQPIRRVRKFSDVKDDIHNRTTFVNKRAEIFWFLSSRLDPSLNIDGYSIPEEYFELRRQMSIIPKSYDQEGRCYILPKNKKDKDSKVKCLSELLGCSPDELDALTIAEWKLNGKMRGPIKVRAIS